MPAANLLRLGWVSLALICQARVGHAEPIRAKYRQGSVHGFASLKTQEGKTIAIGECTQTVRGDRVTSRFIFRFSDGSVDEEQTVFEQRQFFRLISNHHIQRGPSFPQFVDLLIDAVNGELTSRAGDGTVTHEHMDLPADISNGLPPNLLLNVSPAAPETRISYVAPGTKPRLVHLSIKPAGTVLFSVGTMRPQGYGLHHPRGGGRHRRRRGPADRQAASRLSHFYRERRPASVRP